ncbi:ABC transporter permease [Paraburkholderia sp. JHI869]|uniref:ABC transporter permease n=1 Tax=Paraburkholderia sp. JHI869 TaxID=3112959 RepID=UPI00317C668E
MKRLRLNKAAPAALYPLASLAAAIACWQAIVVAWSIPDYVLPGPAEVWRALAAGFADGTLWPHIGATLGETLLGYWIGSVLAVFMGALLAESRVFERFVFPLLAGLQAMPKVALGPIILVWCGYGSASKVVLVVLVCFFPLFVNTVNGLKRADPDLLDACRAFSASRVFLFFHVKLPCAAPEIFSGLQIGVSLALIGAVVGEFLSSQRGLGYLISSASVNMSVATMFAGVVLLAVIGVSGAQLVRAVQRRVVFWERSDGDASRARG